MSSNNVTLPLTAAIMTALNAGGTLTLQAPAASAPPVTTPPVTPPPVITPPLPGNLPIAGSGVCYAEGKMLWPGDWSGNGVVVDYNDSVNGIPCLSVQAVSAWPYWLPYCPLTGGPQGNTPSQSTVGRTNLVIIAKGINGANDSENVVAYTYTVVNGQVTGDVSTGSVSALAQYASAPDAQGFVTYTIPLSVLGISNQNMYKFLFQDNTVQPGQKFYVKYAALV